MEFTTFLYHIRIVVKCVMEFAKLIRKHIASVFHQPAALPVLIQRIVLKCIQDMK